VGFPRASADGRLWEPANAVLIAACREARSCIRAREWAAFHATDRVVEVSQDPP
jgi:hypothetical protein